MANDNQLTKITAIFGDKYKGCSYFVNDFQYSDYLGVCLRALNTPGLLEHMQFCNDILEIAPTRTFLQLFKEEIKNIVRSDDNPDAVLPKKVAQGIGAFWGAVFRGMLGYDQAIRSSVPLKKEFGIQTASWFKKQNAKGDGYEHWKSGSLNPDFGLFE